MADRVGPGKDVRERIEAGSVEMDEQEARRWTVPYVKDPNVARRGDYPIIWSSKVARRRSTLWWTRCMPARTYSLRGSQRRRQGDDRGVRKPAGGDSGPAASRASRRRLSTAGRATIADSKKRKP